MGRASMSGNFPEFRPVFQNAELPPSELKEVYAEALQLIEDHHTLLVPPNTPMRNAGYNARDLSLERWDAQDRVLRSHQQKVLLVVRASLYSQVYEYTDHDSGEQTQGRVSNMILDGTAEEIMNMHDMADAFLTTVPYHFGIEVDGYVDEDPDQDKPYAEDGEHLGRLEITVSSDAHQDTIAGYLTRTDHPDLDGSVVRTFRNWLADAIEIEQ